jgi:hypothetical protein
VRPIQDDETDLERAEREKQERLEKAVALLETHPAYHGVQAENWDAIQELNRQEPLDSLTVNTDERMERMIKVFDVNAQIHLKLVTALEFHKAYCVLIQHFLEESWIQYCGYPWFMIPPPPPGYPPRHEQLKARRFWERMMHWRYEGHRQIHRLNLPDSHVPERRGYRAEVLDWMGRNGIPNLGVAAKRLRVSKSALKSIMSDKGQKRYGDDRLADVLKVVMPE